MFVIKYYLCKCCSSHFSFHTGRLSLCSLLCEPTHPLCSPVVMIGPSQPNYLATNVVFLEFSLNCWNTLLLNTRLPWMFSIAFMVHLPFLFLMAQSRVTGYVDFGIMDVLLSASPSSITHCDKMTGIL